VATWRWVVRPRLERWGATDDEVDVHLPGDHLIAEPASQVTRAITVDAPPEDVWPWIVQLGADRGGFYSYDWLENLFGLGIHSASEVVPDWQERAIGDLVSANAGSTGGWRVVDVRPPDALVLKMVDPTTGEPARRDQGWRWEFLWTFAVRDAGLGRSRLLIRERTGFGSRVTKALLAPVGIVSWFMTQKTLRGIKARAEGLTYAGRGGVLVPPLRTTA
jgi:hypothetical protein